MSRYLDLLKQIPSGNNEISEDLLKKLDIAACNLVNNQAGQYDLTEEERREYADYEPPEVNDRMGRWGLLEKCPLPLGDLAIYRSKNREYWESKDKEYWDLGICFGANPYVVLEHGSKEEVLKKEKQLNEYRETEGEDAFEEEIMRLIDLRLMGED